MNGNIRDGLIDQIQYILVMQARANPEVHQSFQIESMALAKPAWKGCKVEPDGAFIRCDDLALQCNALQRPPGMRHDAAERYTFTGDRNKLHLETRIKISI
ncbi:hypothetical protein FRC03_007318 [Tulasnella sp. 419]|nr:hypothetical protein FRC03_007318 [Tulasnella sp. 419]